MDDLNKNTSENVRKFQEFRTQPKDVFRPLETDQEDIQRFERTKAILRDSAQRELDVLKETGPQVNEEMLGFDLEPTPTAQVGAGLTSEVQTRILKRKGVVSQRFGNRNNIEVFSRGINTGTDFAVKTGTPVALPQGKWQVVEAFNRARQGGFIGNKDNNGYGNSVLVRNLETGETLRFSHLSKIGVNPGQQLQGGVTFATSGNSGNSTGPHLDIEFRNANGRLNDVLTSRFARFLI